MPRGRFLSKSISLDEGVNSLPNDTARLLFTWLIPHLDCEGRLHGDATTVKSIVFPRRSISTRKVDQYLNAIEKSGLIVRYSVNGNAYLFAPHFEKHQTGLQKDREAQSQIPPFTPDLIQINSKKTLTQVKGKGKGKVKGIYIVIFSTWNAQGILTHTKLTDEMKWAIERVSKEHSQEEICQAIKNYAEILKGEQYYFKYSWTLKDFLKRGLEKFLDLKIAQQNYLTQKGGQDGKPRGHSQGASTQELKASIGRPLD